jgi:hypothetical protein
MEVHAQKACGQSVNRIHNCCNLWQRAGMALVTFVSANKRGRGVKRSETSLDIQLARYLDSALPRDAFYLQIRDAARKCLSADAAAIAAGTEAAAPGLVIFWKRRAFCLELKSGWDRLTGQQRSVHAKLHDAGIPVEVVRSVPEAVSRLKEFGIPLKAEIRL